MYDMNLFTFHIIKQHYSFIKQHYSFETFGKTSGETLSLIRDLVGKAAEMNQLFFSRLLSHWKRRFSTVLQKENALFILNSSSDVLFATNRFEPNCEPNLGEVLNLESIHCS